MTIEQRIEKLETEVAEMRVLIEELLSAPSQGINDVRRFVARERERERRPQS